MKRLFAIFLLIAVLAAGCTPAQPTQIAAATRPPEWQAPQVEEPYDAPQPVYAPTHAAAESFDQRPFPSEPLPGQPRVDTYEDHLSTFALDVDTASYTQARQALLNGYLPPADTARVEEFVNYFQQDYPTPRELAFGIYADGTASPFAEENQHLLRFGIQGYRADEETRKPRHLTFVIDASGSMGDPGKLDLVKQTLEVLLDRLGSRDGIAVVAYDDQAWVVLDPTNAANRERIMDEINQLRPGNSTDLNQGLRLGYRLAEKMYNPDVTNRVILCTDGVANTGTVEGDAIVDMIREYAGRDVTLTALGVGMGDYNDALLEQLADQGNGNYAYIDDLDEAQRLFVDKLSATLDVIAMNAKVQVDFNPEVVADYRQLGYEDRAVADQDFRDDRVDAGEIGAGHSVTALYQVRLYPGAEGRIATVQLRWEDPQTHEVQEINGNFNTWDLAGRFEDASPRFQQDVIAAYFAGRLRGAGWAYGAGWDELRDHANRVAYRLEDSAVQELATLIEQASWLAR